MKYSLQTSYLKVIDDIAFKGTLRLLTYNFNRNGIEWFNEIVFKSSLSIGGFKNWNIKRFYKL